MCRYRTTEQYNSGYFLLYWRVTNISINLPGYHSIIYLFIYLRDRYLLVKWFCRQICSTLQPSFLQTKEWMAQTKTRYVSSEYTPTPQLSWVKSTQVFLTPKWCCHAGKNLSKISFTVCRLVCLYANYFIFCNSHGSWCRNSTYYHSFLIRKEVGT